MPVHDAEHAPELHGHDAADDGRRDDAGRHARSVWTGHAVAPTPSKGMPSEATKAYLVAMERMHGPMMEGVQDSNPDAAFVRGMIPHHQGAIDMAKIVLQHGKDEQTRKWATDVIREQEREIGEMQAWLKRQGK